MKIRLNEQELIQAKDVGVKRQELSKNRPDAHGFKGDGEAIHIQGAEAEMAVAKALGMHWNDFAENFKELKSDVGENYQVRSTTHPTGNLLVHKSDRDNDIFILVRTHDHPEFEICGWIKGNECKQEKYWRNSGGPFERRPCYFIRAENLKPIGSLPVDQAEPKKNV